MATSWQRDLALGYPFAVVLDATARVLTQEVSRSTPSTRRAI
jgi:hypothetical protein